MLQPSSTIIHNPYPYQSNLDTQNSLLSVQNQFDKVDKVEYSKKLKNYLIETLTTIICYIKLDIDIDSYPNVGCKTCGVCKNDIHYKNSSILVGIFT